MTNTHYTVRKKNKNKKQQQQQIQTQQSTTLIQKIINFFFGEQNDK